MLHITNLYKEYSAIIAESADEIESIRTDWESIAKQTDRFDPNVDIDHYLTVVSNLDQVISPAVTVIKKNGNVCGIIVGRIENDVFRASIGYLTLFKKKSRCLMITYGGVIIPLEPELSEKIKNILLKYAKSKKLHYITINSLNSNSPLMAAIENSTFPGVLKILLKKQIHWVMKIPDSIEEFYERKSKKHKKNMIYYGNKLLKDHSDKVLVRKYSQIEQIDEMVIAGESVAEKTYQRGMDVGFKDDTLTRSRMSLASEKRWLRSYILYVKDKPVAFQMGFQYKNGYFVQGKGFDPSYTDYRVGTYLFQQILIDLCSDIDIEEWDFGLGDAEYKVLYGTDKWDEQTCYLFTKSPISLLLFFISKNVNMVKEFIEGIIRRSGYYQKIKKLWRAKLTVK